MGLLRWNPATDGPLSEAAMRRKLEALGYEVTRYVYPPGTTFGPHTHAVDKIDAVLAGRFRLGFPEGAGLGAASAPIDHVLGPGDAVEVPRGVVHAAAVVGEEPVVSLDAIRRR